jgi:hypothetical protein
LLQRRFVLVVLGDVVTEDSATILDGKVDGIFDKETRPHHGDVAAKRRLSNEAVG